MARPVMFMTPEQVAQVEKLSAYLNMEQIADFFGVTARTMRRRMNNDPKLTSAFKKGRAVAINDVAEALVSMAKSKNVTAAIFYLKTQAGWREADHVAITSEISKLSDRELEKRRAKVGLVG